MALYGHNFDVFVGSYVDGDGTVTASSLTDNQFGIEAMSTGKLHDGSSAALASGDKFRLVKKNEDGSFRYSPVINFDNIYKGDAVEHPGIAEAQHKINIGFHGAGSDSIRLVNSNRYAIRLNFVNDGEIYSRQKDQYFFEKVSDADAVQAEIVNSLALNMSSMEYLADGSIIGPKRAKISVKRFVNLGSGSESATASVTADFTQGSDIVTFSGAHNVVVGDYIRRASGESTEVYKCTEVLAADGSIRIDQPYQGTTGQAGSGTVKRLTAAVVEVSSVDCGLVLEGLAQFHKVGLYPYSVVEFNVTLDGFGATEVEVATQAQKGNTVGEAVADMEWFSLGRNTQGGASFTGTGFPSAQSYATLDAVASSDYDVVTLNYYLDDSTQYHAIAPGGKIKGTVVLAILDAESGDKTHLDAALAGVDGIGASDLTAGS